MDREEYREKLDQLTDAVSDKDYKKALSIADEIDWRRVKSLNTLNMVADIYEVNRDYEAEKRILLLAYERASIGRSILYRLVEVCLKLNQIGEAEKYFREYEKNAKNDSSRCILQYKLYKATNAPLEAQIDVLEEYRDKEYTERWAYELATLYAKAGDRKKCVDACDDLILWFAEGKYVMKAMELKKRYEPLTPSQQKAYEKMIAEGGYKKAPRERDRVVADAEDRAGARLYREAGLTSSGREKPESGTSSADTDTSSDASGMQEIHTPAEKHENEVPASGAWTAAGVSAEKKTGTSEDAKSGDAEEKVTGTVEDAGADVSEEETPEAEEETYAGEEEETEEPAEGTGFRTRFAKTISNIFGTEKEEDNDLFGGIDAEYTTADEPEMKEEEPPVEEDESGLHMRELKKEDLKRDVTSEQPEEAAGDVQEETAGDLPEETAAEAPEESTADVPEEVHADDTKIFRQDDIQRKADGSLDLNAFLQDSARSMASDVKEDTDDGTAGDLAQAETEPGKEAEEPDASEAVKGPEASEAAEEPEETVEQLGEPAAVSRPENGDIAGEGARTAEEGTTEEGTTEEKPSEDMETEGQTKTEESAAAESAGAEPVVAKSAADALEGLKAGVEAEKTQADQQAEAAVNTEDDTDMKVVPEKTEHKPHYIEELEVPDPEPTPEEKKKHTHTISLDTIGENTVPISIDKILSEETPEERRIRILNKEKPTRMSEEQRKIFTYFARVPGMDGQILEAVNSVYTHAGEKTSMHGNIAIMGARGCGKSRLAHGLIVAMCRDLGMEACKMARISGKTLNKKDAAKVVSVMAGGFLIIEDIAGISETTLNTLNQAMEFRTDRMVMIIEDEKTRMRAFLKAHPQFAAKFDKVISIPVFTNDELVTFARTYATENGCKIDDLAILALYTIIGNMQSEEEPATISDVKEIIDGAILHATKGRRRRGSSDAEKTGKWIIIHEKDLTAGS